MEHSNKILENAIKNSGLSVTQVAKKAGYNRSSIYRHLQDEDLEPDIYIKYGKALNYDFSKEIPDLANMYSAFSEPISNYGVTSVAEALRQRDFWKDKYIGLLENYNELMEKYYSQPKQEQQ